MYRAVLSSIHNIYVENVALRGLALDGLARLSKLDPALSVSEEGNGVTVRVRGVPVSRRPIPRDNDIKGWAITFDGVVTDARKASDMLRESDRERIFQTVFDGMVQKLDPYSRYEGPVEARRNRENREGFGGIGVTIVDSPRGARVVRIQENSPAADTDLKADDEILFVDGRALSGLPLADIVSILRGPVDSTVRLSVLRGAEPRPFDLAVARQRIVPRTVDYRREGNVAVIRLTSFGQQTKHQLEAAIARAATEIGPEMGGVVLDLRGNPGGLLDQAVEVADFFISSGRLSSTRGRHPDSLQLFEARSGDAGERLPLAVLLNGASASAAEILAAALLDHGRAVAIGSTSFGKGTVQTLIRLPNDGELVLTWARLHAPSGYAFHKRGVVPTVCTSDANDSATVIQAVATVQSGPGRPVTAEAFAALGSESTAQIPCPWNPRDGHDVDLEVAKGLLDKPLLFRHALQQSAGRPGN